MENSDAICYDKFGSDNGGDDWAVQESGSYEGQVHDQVDQGLVGIEVESAQAPSSTAPRRGQYSLNYHTGEPVSRNIYLIIVVRTPIWLKFLAFENSKNAATKVGFQPCDILIY